MANLNMTTVGNAGWIGYSGPQKEAAVKFYADVMNWQMADLPMKDGSSVPGIMVGDGPIGGFTHEPAEVGAWTIYVTVEDVDGSTEKARAAGADILNGPIDIPGVGRITTMIDPQGARIAMVTYESMQG